MHIIVTHRSVDIDCITACWLIKRFLPDWKEADVEFVNAGSTKNSLPADSDKNIIHVDTGFGQFDHHQKNDFTTATKKTFEYLAKNNHINQKYYYSLEKMIAVVNDLDHFKEVHYPDPANDRYDFMLHQIIEGLKGVLGKDKEIMETGFILLDAIFQIFRNKVKAEEAIKKGFVFHSKYGKSIIMETQNEEAMKLALKNGFTLVLRKDPIRGHVRIKTFPDKKYDLTIIYETILKVDKKGTWFLHVNKHMLLNSSSKNPNFIPSPLTSKKLIEIIKNI